MVELTKNPEAAWAAGLFEGEGHITANLKAPRGRPRVVATLSSCDKDVLDRFVRIMGGGSVRVVEPKEPHHRRAWTWTITGKAARPVLELLRPWLGTRRGEAADRGLALVEEIGPANSEKTHCPQGHVYSPENTYLLKSNRMCKVCNRAGCRKRYWLKKVVAEWPS